MNALKLTLIALLLFCIQFGISQDCSAPQSKMKVEGANIKATNSITNTFNFDNSQQGFEALIYPKDRDVSPIFKGSFWVGAKDALGNIKVSRQTFGNFLDYSIWSAGPDHDSQSCINWDKQFKLDGSDVRAFTEDLSDGILDKEIPLSILGWPGNGNPFFESVHGFEMLESSYGYAGFQDFDGDGIYDPSKGDVPET